MVKNYFKVSWRQLRRHRVFGIITVFGLSISITSVLLIGLYAHYILTYDTFHESADRTFMVYKERITPNGVQPTYDTWLPMLKQLQLDFPQVEKGCRFFTSDVKLGAGDRFFEEEVIYADPTFFEVFNFPLETGGKPLADIKEVIISQETAEKFFGSQDPMGQMLEVKDRMIGFEQQYVVAGILEDYPSNSSIEPNIVLPLESIPQISEYAESWEVSFMSTYVVLNHPNDAAQLLEAFPGLVEKIWDEETRSRTNLKLMPLTATYATMIGELSYVYLLLYLGGGLLLIAAINYMNLSTARSIERTREVGLRKVLGAGIGQLYTQFLQEAFLASFLSMLLSVLLLLVITPSINSWLAINLALAPLWTPMGVIILVTGIVVFTFLAGAYPAFFLSRRGIASAIKSRASDKRSSGIRNTLVIFQFVITVFLIIGSLMVREQLNFMINADKGYDASSIVVLASNVQDYEDQELGESRISAFRNEVSQLTGVEFVSSSVHIPTRWSRSFTFVAPDEWEGDPMRMRYTSADAQFFDTYQIPLLEGQVFSTEDGPQNDGVILNQAALKAFGWSDINEKAIKLGRSRVPVVGLVEDFHFESMRNEVAPTLHLHRSPKSSRNQFISIRLAKVHYKEAVHKIEEVWAGVNPNMEFNLVNLTETTRRLYENETQLLRLVSLFSVVAVVIAFMGLFGLVVFTLQRRQREISIRKVVGATNASIIWLMVKLFGRLILVAYVIGAVLAYYGTLSWLQDFANRTAIDGAVFVMTLLTVVSLLFITIWYQSFRAANANPAKVLSEE